MAYPRLDIVDPLVTTTVLWSFNDHTGAVNPNAVRTKLGPVRFGSNAQIATFEPAITSGGFVSHYRDGIVSSDLRFYPTATSADNLASSLGVLTTHLGTGGVMVWQRTATSAERYIDFLPSPRVSYLRGQHLPDLTTDSDGITVEFFMQPYLRGAEVTVGPTNVPNDPASSGGRSLSVAISGDLPTPVKIKARMDASSTIERILVAHHTTLGSRGLTGLSDYVAGTKYMQCEATGNGWTIALGTDTTATTDANASPGSGNTIARCTFATTPTVYRRVVRGTRTANLDSLRGSWDVWVRVKSSAVSLHTLKLGWGPSIADPPAFFNAEVPHDTGANGTPPSFGYVEKNLGQINLPEDSALSGLALEVHARRDSGSGNFDMDHLWLVSKDGQGTIVVPGGSKESWLGSKLTSPPFKLTADPTWTAGAVVGTALRLNAVNEAGGAGPNTGTVWGVGRHRVTFKIRRRIPPGAGITMQFGVANVTDDTTASASSVAMAASGGTTFRREFDGVAAKAYQPRFGITADGGAVSWHIDVIKVWHEVLPVLVENEYARTDPGTRYTVDRLDTSGNIAGYLSTEGEIPAMLQPGTNVLGFRFDEDPIVFYDENQNVRTRTPAVTLNYSPRYVM